MRVDTRGMVRKSMAIFAGTIALALMAVGAWTGLSATAQSSPEVRLALVISQTSYSGELSRVGLAQREGNAVSDALIATGFSVTRERDLKREDLNRALDDFRVKLERAGPSAVGFVYYTGHGLQHPQTGDSYLLGVDARLQGMSDLARYGLDMQSQRDGFAATGAKAIFLVFDACRNVPSIPGFKANVKGLNRVEASADMLIAFSTSINSVAEEGVYAPILAEELLRPGLTADAAFAAVQRRVAQNTGRRQLPWTNNLLYNSVCFAGCGADAARPGTSQGLPAPQAGLPAPSPARPDYLDARTTPATTRASLISGDPRSLPDFALFRECEGCPEMVILPTNTYNMGSTDGDADEKPVRQVSIRRFAVSRFETTWDEWDACVAAGACNGSGPEKSARGFDAAKGQDWGWGKGRRPAIFIDWNDARTFAGFATGRTGATYRLPSEAEWEYAARAGSGEKYAWGPVDPVCDQQAFTGANFDACTDDRTRPVGSFRANRYGLFDLHGNVWEWVEDCYENSYSAGQANDGTAFTKGSCSNRVIRGGSWVNLPSFLRSANRLRDAPAIRGDGLGFRLARTL